MFNLLGVNGTLETNQIRKFEITTPNIALTALSLVENCEMLLFVGMNDVIIKPFIPQEFYTVIAGLI